MCPNGCKAIVDSSSNRIEGPADDIAVIHAKIKARAFFFNKWTVRIHHINNLNKFILNETFGNKFFWFKVFWM